ncbi:diguanylate cyclase [Tropicimonas sp. IMCC34011]|uniref:diguanylate cyclase n=1 Tax=Tropicimonas sp. IMCC34011 TaxID=2248759 RepID=UPI000E277E6B|nr:diguanylate cyclase [Tropicimonas sp. IMCC34011]
MSGPILIVDDLATNRIALKAQLGESCHDFVQATLCNGLREARRTHPQIILLSVGDDRLGVSLCRRMKADPLLAHVPIIAILRMGDESTSNDAPAIRRGALHAGAEDVMSVPVDATLLLARIRNLRRVAAEAQDMTPNAVLGPDTFATSAPAPNLFGTGLAEAAQTFERPGRAVIVASDRGEAILWRGRLARFCHHAIEIMDRTEALDAWEERRRRPSGRDADARTPPDLFLVLSRRDALPGEVLGLVNDLRSNEATRQCGIIVATSDPEIAAYALDIGAWDVIGLPVDFETCAILLSRQIARKRVADRRRRALRDGLEAAVLDPLTGLANRRAVLAVLADTVHNAARTKSCCGVLVVDLDNFKDVNDTFGHAAGDIVLSEIASRLSRACRTRDLIGRIGGEEFLVILPDTDLTETLAMAERLRREASSRPVALASTPAGSTMEREAHSLKQTISIGLTTFCGEDGRSSAEILADADQALYGAKTAGRNRVIRSCQNIKGSRGEDVAQAG